MKIHWTELLNILRFSPTHSYMDRIYLKNISHASLFLTLNEWFYMLDVGTNLIKAQKDGCFISASYWAFCCTQICPWECWRRVSWSCSWNRRTTRWTSGTSSRACRRAGGESMTSPPCWKASGSSRKSRPTSSSGCKLTDVPQIVEFSLRV